MPQVALLLSTLIWGATFPATKAVLDQLPPLSFLFIRFCLGTLLVLGVYGLVAGRPGLDRGLARRSAIATVFLFLGYVTQTVGLRDTTASNSAFITALYVVLVPVFLRRFDGRTWFAAGLSVAGLWLLVNPFGSVNVGDLWSLACAVAFGAHIACLESYTRAGDPWKLFVWQMVLVTIVLAPVMMLESRGADAWALTPVLGLALLITGVLATGAFAVQIWVQQILPAQKVALIYSMEPAYAAWLAWYFLGERMGVQGLIGSGLILLAVVIGSLTQSVSRLQQPLGSAATG